MRQENIDFLEANRLCHKEVIGHPSHGRSASLAARIDSRLLNIMREEFEPGFPYQQLGGCSDCLFNLVNAVYARFDEYLAANPKPIVIAATFPKQEAPQQIDPEYAEFLRWKEFKNQKSAVNNAMDTVDELVKMYPVNGKESPEARKARLADPNRVIKRRAKRK